MQYVFKKTFFETNKNKFVSAKLDILSSSHNSFKILKALIYTTGFTSCVLSLLYNKLCRKQNFFLYDYGLMICFKPL